jgi:hypothetical protein
MPTLDRYTRLTQSFQVAIVFEFTMMFLASILLADSELFSFKGAIFSFAVLSALVSTCSIFPGLLSPPACSLEVRSLFRYQLIPDPRSRTLVGLNHGHQLTPDRPSYVLSTLLYTISSSILSNTSPDLSRHAHAAFLTLYICVMVVWSDGSNSHTTNTAMQFAWHQVKSVSYQERLRGKISMASAQARARVLDITLRTRSGCKLHL